MRKNNSVAMNMFKDVRVQFNTHELADYREDVRQQIALCFDREAIQLAYRQSIESAEEDYKAAERLHGSILEKPLSEVRAECDKRIAEAQEALREALKECHPFKKGEHEKRLEKHLCEAETLTERYNALQRYFREKYGLVLNVAVDRAFFDIIERACVVADTKNGKALYKENKGEEIKDLSMVKVNFKNLYSMQYDILKSKGLMPVAMMPEFSRNYYKRKEEERKALQKKNKG